MRCPLTTNRMHQSVRSDVPSWVWQRQEKLYGEKKSYYQVKYNIAEQHLLLIHNITIIIRPIYSQKECFVQNLLSKIYKNILILLTCNEYYGRAEHILPANLMLVLFHLLFKTFPYDVKRDKVGQSVTNVYGYR